MLKIAAPRISGAKPRNSIPAWCHTSTHFKSLWPELFFGSGVGIEDFSPPVAECDVCGSGRLKVKSVGRDSCPILTHVPPCNVFMVGIPNTASQWVSPVFLSSDQCACDYGIQQQVRRPKNRSRANHVAVRGLKEPRLKF